jgi:hypothetical protein
VKRRIIIYEEGVVPWDEQGNQENAEPVTVTNTRRVIPFPAIRKPYSDVKCLRRSAFCRAKHPIRPGISQKHNGFFSGRAPPQLKQVYIHVQ